MNPPRGNRPPPDDDPDATVDHAGPPAARADPRGDATAVTGSDDREERLLSALSEYKAALEAGRHPDRRELLARNPDIATDLTDCLDGLAFVQSAAGQIAGAGAGLFPGDPGIAFEGPDAPDGAGDGGADALEGRPLGDFRLVREVGRGGMGVVYEAVQVSLGRRVAVKVLPLASALDPRHLQRFRNEAQAAARLHHTNIVPVYAVGYERSVHFYAMQLIEGRSLSDIVRDLRWAAGRDAAGAGAGGRVADATPDDAPGGTPRGSPTSATTDRPAARSGAHPPTVGGGTKPGSGSAAGSASRPTSGSAGGSSVQLTPALSSADGSAGSHSPESFSSLRSARGRAYYLAAARLWLQAAEALDYAHAAGVVHRDIKPANLLLDGRGTLWVTDFGLAQFYADAGPQGLTQAGDLVGTLRYMSPEQASGRAVVLDQRTDVYSLGVTFYELLTLERALPGETREQLLHQIGTHDPRPARAVDRAIPAELETILGKATAKDPADRYPSARALADDLRRFLQDEPILARPPTALDRAVKWTRRHRAVAVSAVVILVLTAIGLGVSTLLIAGEQAKTKSAFLREQAGAAEVRRQRASAAASFDQARDVVNFLSRVAADELADNPGAAEVRKGMLEAALDYYEGFLDARRQDPSVRAELTEAQAYVQNILGELSAFAEFDRVDAATRLLVEPPVQQALGLSAEQAAQARLVGGDDGDGPDGSGPGGRTGRGRDGLGAGGPRGPGAPGSSRGPGPLRGLSSEEKRARYAAAAARIEAALAGLLTPAQLDRLWQITRQVRAPASFGDRDVADALSLTREQKDAVRRAQVSFRIAARKASDPGRRRPPPPPPQDGRPLSPQESFEAVTPSRQALYDEAVRRVMSLLTPAQAAAWWGLTGDPFPAAASLNRGPFGPGGPDGGRPGGPPPQPPPADEPSKDGPNP